MSEQERRQLAALPLEDKVAYGKDIVRQALQRAARPVVLYTGGKDSTVLLWMVRQTGNDGVPAMILDHGLHFSDTWDFIDSVKEKWGIELTAARNQDVLANAGDPGEPIRVDDLNARNQREVRGVLGYQEATFPYTLDTEVGNHLLKTVALNEAIEDGAYDYVFVGIRWDEHPARAEEAFFSPRKAPDHFRVHPILPLTEGDIWSVMRGEGLPTHPLYKQGFRSLDSLEAEKLDDRPAWEQELGEGERAGREQDKENIMERLRGLGYM